MRHRVLIVEDERALRDNLARVLENAGFSCSVAASAEEARGNLKRNPPAAVVSDICLPGEDGLALTRHIREEYPEVVVLLMTAYASTESAVQALRLGASDYLVKPILHEDLILKLRRLLRNRQMELDRELLREEVQRGHDFHHLVADSPAMAGVLECIEQAAASTSTVLITGETGTGKELVARAIHHRSERRDAIFAAVNVAAIPGELLESHLFGHEKGAFTGATASRKGVLRAAEGGTLFLDEVGELPLAFQAKLLRVLEHKEVMPVGRDLPVSVDARILAATNRELQQMCASGQFRLDLYYRLNVLSVALPPLRERLEDLPALTEQLLHRHAGRAGRRIEGIAPDALAALRAYDWRGNVRELSSVLERAVLRSKGTTVLLEHLPKELAARPAECGLKLRDALDAFEARFIAETLAGVAGSREQAAAALGISQPTLYRRLQKLGVR